MLYPKLEAALRYAEYYGFSVIPCDNKKRPYIPWERYQKEKADSEQIKKWWKKWHDANPAIVTGSISGICVIDVDNEEGMDNLNEYLPESFVTPIVLTPGGGKHLWFKANGECLRNHASIIPGCDFRGEGGYIMAPPSQAWSEHGKKKIFGGYRWEVSIKDTSLSLLPKKYIDYINSNKAYGNINNIQARARSINHTMFKSGHRDEDLFHVANCLIKGGASDEEARQVIEKLALACDPPFSLKEAELKIKSALQRTERKNRNLAAEVRDFVLSTSGYILSTDVYGCLQLTTREDRKNVSIILKRLAGEGIIEKYGDRNGCFRRVETDCSEIDWQNASTDSFSITLPLFLNSLVHIMPKNIIVVAGAPDTGKTAFLLNVAVLNINSENIFYYSSEMGDAELKKRLNGFEIGPSTWKKAKFYERTSNFADIIQPDGINIIDYLELNQDFWLVAKQLTDVHNRLKKGIAFVALQKNPGAAVGRGGTFGLEKPRLYLSIDKNPTGGQILKIIKAKNWAHEINPNGMVKTFKIIKGCKLLETSEWKIQN